MNQKCGSVQINQNVRVGNNPVQLADGSTSAAPTQLLDQNLDREELILQNVGIVTIYVALGFPASITNYSFALLPCGSAHDGTGGIFISDSWKGAVYAIGASAGALMAITEEV